MSGHWCAATWLIESQDGFLTVTSLVWGAQGLVGQGVVCRSLRVTLFATDLLGDHASREYERRFALGP
jgi:hypothetical protein